MRFVTELPRKYIATPSVRLFNPIYFRSNSVTNLISNNSNVENNIFTTDLICRSILLYAHSLNSSTYTICFPNLILTITLRREETQVNKYFINTCII